MKKPEAGEWWGKDGKPSFYMVGRTPEGRMVYVEFPDHDSPSVDGSGDWYGATHLPECTGWNWTSPDWVTQDRTYLRKGDWYKTDVGQVSWLKANYDFPTLRHGQDGYQVRCLREELPPLPPKTPKAGDWWQARDLDSVVLVHGVTKLGVVLVEYKSGGNGYCTTKDFMTWYKHSPDCKGWE